MANIETWCCDGKIEVEVVEPRFERRIVIRAEGNSHSGCLRMTCLEAVTLCDELSRAIAKVAQAKAKAVQAEGAQS